MLAGQSPLRVAHHAVRRDTDHRLLLLGHVDHLDVGVLAGLALHHGLRPRLGQIDAARERT